MMTNTTTTDAQGRTYRGVQTDDVFAGQVRADRVCVTDTVQFEQWNNSWMSAVVTRVELVGDDVEVTYRRDNGETGAFTTSQGNAVWVVRRNV